MNLKETGGWGRKTRIKVAHTNIKKANKKTDQKRCELRKKITQKLEELAYSKNDWDALA